MDQIGNTEHKECFQNHLKNFKGTMFNEYNAGFIHFKENKFLLEESNIYYIVRLLMMSILYITGRKYQLFAKIRCNG